VSEQQPPTTGAFNGAAGKLRTHDLRGNHTLLKFVFVQ
jgi:hypothetical protein